MLVASLLGRSRATISPMRLRALRFAIALGLTLARAAAAGPADVERDAYLADQRGLMTVLAGWSAGSIATGAVMWSRGGSLVRYAGIQNVAWGAIDGGLAVASLLSSRGDSRSDAPAGHWLEERQKLRRIFWINAALDVLYLGAGAALAGFGKRDSLRGSGAGVLAQGGFLLVFDLAGALVIGP
jgi:hypothetical protein